MMKASRPLLTLAVVTAVYPACAQLKSAPQSLTHAFGGKSKARIEHQWLADYQKELEELKARPLAQTASLDALQTLKEWNDLAWRVDGKTGGSLEREEPELNARYKTFLAQVLAARDEYLRNQAQALGPEDARFFLATFLIERDIGKFPELMDILRSKAQESAAGVKKAIASQTKLGGQCVFSSKPVGPSGQAADGPGTHFKVPSRVYTRCFSEKPAEVYSKSGHSPRSDGNYFLVAAVNGKVREEKPLGGAGEVRGKRSFEAEVDALPGKGGLGLNTVSLVYRYIERFEEGIDSNGRRAMVPIWAGTDLAEASFTYEAPR